MGGAEVKSTGVKTNRVEFKRNPMGWGGVGWGWGSNAQVKFKQTMLNLSGIDWVGLR